jgi:hypothetical protein
MANLMVGWGIANMLTAIAGGCVTGILTCGLFPIGVLCGFAGFLVLPIGMIELLVGILAMAQPATVKGFIKYMPFIQIPSLLLGGVISPLAGGVALMLLRDPDVTAYIEGY